MRDRCEHTDKTAEVLLRLALDRSHTLVYSKNKRAPTMHAQATMHAPMLFLLTAALCLHAAGVSAAVFTPPSPLFVNAFAGANESWFRFPEASSGGNYSMLSVTSRPRFGIAISGGGMRAATLGLGYLRGIQQVHVLSDVGLAAGSGTSVDCACVSCRWVSQMVLDTSQATQEAAG